MIDRPAARRLLTPLAWLAVSGTIVELCAREIARRSIVHHLTGAHPPSTLDRSLVFDLATFESRLEPGPLTTCSHTNSAFV